MYDMAKAAPVSSTSLWYDPSQLCCTSLWYSVNMCTDCQKMCGTQGSTDRGACIEFSERKMSVYCYRSHQALVVLLPVVDRGAHCVSCQLHDSQNNKKANQNLPTCTSGCCIALHAFTSHAMPDSAWSISTQTQDQSEMQCYCALSWGELAWQYASRCTASDLAYIPKCTCMECFNNLCTFM